MTAQAALWTAAGAALAGAALCALADWRRQRRRNLDDAGLVPWRGLQVALLFAAAALAILAGRAG